MLWWKPFQALIGRIVMTVLIPEWGMCRAGWPLQAICLWQGARKQDPGLGIRFVRNIVGV